jgi:hypothetical protein
MMAHSKILSVIFMLFMIIFTVGADPVIVSGGPENDYESWIARLTDDRLMIVFCRNPDWTSGDLYVTFSTNDGDSWEAPTPIIVQAGDQATLSFVQLPGDTLRLWYASNEGGEYNIYSAHSTDGIDWTLEGRTELGWQLQDRYYDPTMIMEADGSLTMSYRGPDGAYVAHCPYGGTWDTLRTQVAAGGYRPRIMKHQNGTYVYAYHRNIGGNQYEVHVRTSTDLSHWSSETVLTSQGNSHDAFVNATPDSGYLIYYGTYQYPAYNLFRRRSYNTVDWEPEEQITSDPYWNTQPHFFIQSYNVYLVWAHATTSAGDTYDVYFERTPYIVGIEEKKNAAAGICSMQPVPCSDVITVTFSTKKLQHLNTTIYDVMGREIMAGAPHEQNTSSNITVNTSTLSGGTYFMKIQWDGGQLFKKFVVMR